jgi:hypothetical protein
MTAQEVFFSRQKTVRLTFQASYLRNKGSADYSDMATPTLLTTQPMICHVRSVVTVIFQSHRLRAWAQFGQMSVARVIVIVRRLP